MKVSWVGVQVFGRGGADDLAVERVIGGLRLGIVRSWLNHTVVRLDGRSVCRWWA